MSSRYITLINTIRRFNRFYINILGLLDKHIYESEFSLAEVRVLYDIGHTEVCTAKKLIEELKMDPGYLSRIIKRFEKDNLIYRVQSQEDGRLYYLYLTDKGQDTLSKLDDLSNDQIYKMISSLPEQDKKSVVESMKTIENALSEKPIKIKDEIIIRNELRPGDVGFLIHLHGWIYAQECKFNYMFEGYVCKTIFDLFNNYNVEKDRFWFAEANGEIIGAIAIVGQSASRAQLRWFILHPLFRGIGLGNTLVNEAMKYCKEKGYKQVFLVTTDDQEIAIKMYTKIGFRKVAEHENKVWGKNLIEHTYELNLP
ncbi:bifunctional helix-turn-helix transcriptional regulator/GNAT family N-acetyltransferase [Desulfosporosinus hippei]|uniref:Transcriptional regulator, MarR family with acetyltransferase activity n=1 Tax=Desulfosporosinus hippei DSM 8344 TaxID=1121419 RepID=A0A1G8JJI6_9FIRM|nr:helix-turn-helix domain-containing GNAT family N-acetyltransferase [Desulfosporosinus hippei]SDI31365.1 transcriptional regulator, MarR family with acetyltransferase activity [Desulfosporosinus hippei DSM 8344]